MNMGYFKKTESGSIIFELPHDSYKDVPKEEALQLVGSLKKMMAMIDSKALVNQTYPFEGMSKEL